MSTNPNPEPDRYHLALALADLIGGRFGTDLLTRYAVEAARYGEESEGALLAFATLEHTATHVAEGTPVCGGPEC
jgi:hypothetical protein